MLDGTPQLSILRSGEVSLYDTLDKRARMALTMDQSAFPKRLYAIVGGGACALLILVWVFVKDGLSPRGFAVTVLIWWIAMFAVIFQLIRNRQRSAEDIRKKQVASGVSPEALDRDQCVRNIRNMKRLIAMFAIFLGYGMLATQGEPLLPRAVGAGVDVFFLAAFINSLIQSQKQLKALSAGREIGSSDIN
jgi:predicted secreted protein